MMKLPISQWTAYGTGSGLPQGLKQQQQQQQQLTSTLMDTHTHKTHTLSLRTTQHTMQSHTTPCYKLQVRYSHAQRARATATATAVQITAHLERLVACPLYNDCNCNTNRCVPLASRS